MPPPALEIASASNRLAERCVAYLKGLILDGGLEPGQYLAIDEVARVLGMSRQPVMDAVKRLAAEGFIHVRPQVGSRVVVPEPDHVADFYEVFARSEGLIARFAAERRSPEEAARFGELATRIGTESRGGSLRPGDPRYRTLNRRFHAAIHCMARSPVAEEIAAGMWDRSDFYIRAAFGAPYFDAKVRAAQAAVSAAIVGGDAAKAERVVVDHLRAVGASAAKRLRAR